MENEEKRPPERTFIFFLFGVIIGLVCGYLLNLEKSAQAQAFAFCGNVTEAYNELAHAYNKCIRDADLSVGFGLVRQLNSTYTENQR